MEGLNVFWCVCCAFLSLSLSLFFFLSLSLFLSLFSLSLSLSNVSQMGDGLLVKPAPRRPMSSLMSWIWIPPFRSFGFGGQVRRGLCEGRSKGGACWREGPPS